MRKLTEGIEGERAQARIRGLARAKREAEAKIAQLEADHKKHLEDLKKAHEGDREKWQAETVETVALAQAGIHDPAVLAGLRAHLATLPEADQKAGLRSFIETRQAALKAGAADPKKAPASLPWLDGYLTPKKTADPPPDLETGTRDGKVKITPEDIRAAFGKRDPIAMKKFTPAS
jgi:hypothetical protein